MTEIKVEDLAILSLKQVETLSDVRFAFDEFEKELNELIPDSFYKVMVIANLADSKRFAQLAVGQSSLVKQLDELITDALMSPEDARQLLMLMADLLGVDLSGVTTKQ